MPQKIVDFLSAYGILRRNVWLIGTGYLKFLLDTLNFSIGFDAFVFFRGTRLPPVIQPSVSDSNRRR